MPLHCFNAEILRWGWRTRNVPYKLWVGKSRGTVCSFQFHYNISLRLLQKLLSLPTSHDSESKKNMKEVAKWVSQCNTVMMENCHFWMLANIMTCFSRGQFKINKKQYTRQLSIVDIHYQWIIWYRIHSSKYIVLYREYIVDIEYQFCILLLYILKLKMVICWSSIQCVCFQLTFHAFLMECATQSWSSITGVWGNVNIASFIVCLPTSTPTTIAANQQF